MSSSNSTMIPSISSSASAQQRLNNALKTGVDKACETANNLRTYISPKVIGGIVVFAIIVILLIYYFLFKKDEKVIGLKEKNIIPYIHDLKVEKTINQRDIPDSSQGNEYNVNFWLFVNDYDYKYNDKKIIFYKGDRNNMDEANPLVYLKPKENTLVVQIGLQTANQSLNLMDPTSDTKQNNSSINTVNNIPLTPDISSEPIVNTPQVSNQTNVQPNSGINSQPNTFNNPNSYSQDTYAQQNSPQGLIEGFQSNNNFTNVEPSPDNNQSQNFDMKVTNIDLVEVKNIPLQRWCNVNISLYNNILDISLDGKLEVTKILKGFPVTNKGNLRVGVDGGANGYVSNMIFTNKTIDMDQVLSIYNSGPTLQAGLFN